MLFWKDSFSPFKFTVWTLFWQYSVLILAANVLHTFVKCIKVVFFPQATWWIIGRFEKNKIHFFVKIYPKVKQLNKYQNIFSFNCTEGREKEKDTLTWEEIMWEFRKKVTSWDQWDCPNHRTKKWMHIFYLWKTSHYTNQN